MNTLILSSNDAKIYMEAQTALADKIINTVKKYFSENSEMITAGLAGMYGATYIPSVRR